MRLQIKVRQRVVDVHLEAIGGLDNIYLHKWIEMVILVYTFLLSFLGHAKLVGLTNLTLL